MAINWGSLDSEILNYDATDVLDSLVIKLFDNNDEELATSELVLTDKYNNDRYYKGSVKNATPAAFHYWGFERTPEDYPISWIRSEYKGGATSGSNYDIDVTKPSYAEITIKTINGKKITINTN